MAKPPPLTEAQVERLRELLRVQSRETREKTARKELHKLRHGRHVMACHYQQRPTGA